jgi:hypothetical protein
VPHSEAAVPTSVLSCSKFAVLDERSKIVSLRFLLDQFLVQCARWEPQRQRVYAEFTIVIIIIMDAMLHGVHICSCFVGVAEAFRVHLHKGESGEKVMAGLSGLYRDAST